MPYQRRRRPVGRQRRPREYQPAKKDNKLVLAIIGGVIVIFAVAAYVGFSTGGGGGEDEGSLAGNLCLLKGADKLEKGDLDGALQSFNSAVALDPDIALNYAMRGLVKLQLDDTFGALRDFNKAIELNPDEGLAYAGRGTIRIGLGQLDKAIEDFNKAIAVDPKDEIAYCGRGAAKLLKGDCDGAIADLDKAIANWRTGTRREQTRISEKRKNLTNKKPRPAATPKYSLYLRNHLQDISRLTAVRCAV
jgi:tetratricopeptide (TPR) repeat protein